MRVRVNCNTMVLELGAVAKNLIAATPSLPSPCIQSCPPVIGDFCLFVCLGGIFIKSLEGI